MTFWIAILDRDCIHLDSESPYLGRCDCDCDREKSAVSHSIIWSRPLTAHRVEIEGAEAYAVSGLFLFDRLWTMSTVFFSSCLYGLNDLIKCIWYMWRNPCGLHWVGLIGSALPFSSWPGNNLHCAANYYSDPVECLCKMESEWLTWLMCQYNLSFIFGNSCFCLNLR